MIHRLLTINGLDNVRVTPAGTLAGIDLYVINRRDDGSLYSLCVAYEFDLHGIKVLALTDSKSALETWKTDPTKLKASYDTTVATFANAADIMAQLHNGVNIHPWIIAGLLAGNFPGAEAAARAWTAARARERDARQAEIDKYRKAKADEEAAKYNAAKVAFIAGGAEVAGEDVYRMAREYAPTLHPRSAGALRKLLRVSYEAPNAYNMAIKSGGKCNNATFSSISRTLWQVREAMAKAGVTAGHAEAV